MILAPSCRLAGKLPSQFSNVCLHTLRRQSILKPSCAPKPLQQQQHLNHHNHHAYLVSSSSFTTATSQPKHQSNSSNSILPSKTPSSFSPTARDFSIFAPLCVGNVSGKPRKTRRSPKAIPQESESTSYQRVVRDTPPKEQQQEEEEVYHTDPTVHKPEVYYPTLLPHEDIASSLRKEDAANNALRQSRNYLLIVILAYAIATYIFHKRPESLGKKLGEWFDVDYNHLVFRGCKTQEEKYGVVVQRFFTYSVMDYVDPEATIFGGKKKVVEQEVERGFGNSWNENNDGGEVKKEEVGKQIGWGRSTMMWAITPFQTILPVLAHGSGLHFIMNSLATFVSTKPLVAIFGVRKTLIWMPLLMAWVSGWFPVMYERWFNEQLRPSVMQADGTLRVKTFEELSERFMYLVYKKEGMLGGGSGLAVFQQQQQQQQQQQLSNPDGGNKDQQQTSVEKLLYGEDVHKNLTDSERHELGRLQRLLNSNLGSSGVVCGMLAVHAVMNTPVRFGLTQKLSASPGNFLLALTTWAAYTTFRDEPSGVGHLGHVGGIVGGLIAAVMLKRVGFRPLHEFKWVFR